MRALTFLLLSCIITQSALAQDPAAEADATETRAVSSLTPQQIHAYREGRGMGAGRVADANGYPGPMHVLELAEVLELSDEQRAATAALMSAMKAEAGQLGKQLIAREQALDQQFVDRSVDGESLKVALMEIGELQARIRLAHLNAHIDQRALLSETQLESYSKSRREARAARGPGRQRDMGCQHGQMRQRDGQNTDS